jgi:hypothetical protein
MSANIDRSRCTKACLLTLVTMVRAEKPCSMDPEKHIAQTRPAILHAMFRYVVGIGRSF